MRHLTSCIIYDTYCTAQYFIYPDNDVLAKTNQMLLLGTNKYSVSSCIPMSKLDIVFCALPYSHLNHIYAAPAILKGVAVSNGYSAKTVDFGLKLLELCDRDLSKFDRVQAYFADAEGDEEHSLIIKRFYDSCIEWFEANPSRMIGISVLSMMTQKATYQLCQLIRERLPDRIIVIGGRGAKVPIYSPIRHALQARGQAKIMQFSDFLLKRHLIDHAIIGDGEDALLDLLQGNVASTQQDNRSDSFRAPVPDYNDYEFDRYLIDEMYLPITGSKGCVRDCDFCDVKYQFGKYRYRDGNDIAQEMITLQKLHGVSKFVFTDSLVNGGMKPFMQFLETISRHNVQNPDDRITWTGQYICRPSNQVPKDLYVLLAQSGAQGLSIGAESGSNRVLDAINKKTTVEALYDEIESFRHHGITCNLLTFVGHWSETWDDFLDHCRMFVKIAPYVRSGTVSSVALNGTMRMLEGTPAMFQQHHNGTMVSDFNDAVWFNIHNADNTFKERVRRHLIVYKLCKKLQIPTIMDPEFFLALTNTIKYQHQQINEFFAQHVSAGA